MAGKPCPPTAPVTIRHRWRFAIVLLAALLLAVAQPLTSGLFDDQGSFDIFFSLLIGAVLLLVFEEREHRRIAISLGLAAFLGIWASHGFGGLAGRVLLVGAHLLAVVLFCVRLVRDSPCNLRQTGVGRRDLWRGLRLSSLGDHLEPVVLGCGNSFPGIVPFAGDEKQRCRGCASGPRHSRLLQLHYPGHRRDTAT